MDKIKKEGLSASFYKEVIDLTIEFFFRKWFSNYWSYDLGINVTVNS